LLKDKDNSTYAFSIIPISCTSEKNSGHRQKTLWTNQNSA